MAARESLAADRRADRGRILFFLAVLHLLCHALLSMLTPLYVAIQRDFGLAHLEPVTALSTWLAVTFAIATLGAGWLCDRAPGRWIAGVGLVFHGLGLIGLARAPDLGWARFWLVIAGIGAAGYHPVAARQIIGLYPRQVGKAMGLVAIGAAVGFYLGPLFAGWRTELAGWQAPLWQASAWRPAMFEAGLAAVVVAALYLLLTVEPVLVEAERVNSGPGRRDKALLVGAVGFLGLLLIPRDFAGIGFDALNSLFLQRGEGYGLSVGVVGALLGYKGLISLLTNPAMAWVSDRGQRLYWWAGTLLASAICGGLVPFLPPPAAKVALVLHGMFFLANFPIFEAALVERLPARVRGRAYALILAIVGVFSAFAPKYVGGRVDRLLAPGEVVPVANFQGLYLGLAVWLLASLLAVPVLTLVKARGQRLH